MHWWSVVHIIIQAMNLCFNYRVLTQFKFCKNLEYTSFVNFTWNKTLFQEDQEPHSDIIASTL